MSRMFPFRPARQTGFSLIELMVALVLGLLVVGAAIGIYLSNRQTYATTQSLGRMQESARVAFELMARDIREAGGNPCDSSLVPNNITDAVSSSTPTGASWFLSLNQPLYGFEGSDASAPSHVAGTDVIQLVGPAAGARSVTVDTTAATAAVTYAPGTPAFADNQGVMICDMKVLGVFKANGASTTGTSGTVSYAAGSGRNACGYFPYPNTGVCAGTGTSYQFGKFAQLTAIQGVRWFVRDPDNNAANGYSLYRQVDNGSPQEVTQGVQDLQITYLTDTGYVTADSIASADAWNSVRAVRIDMTVQDSEKVGTDGTSSQPIVRQVEHVVTLRNRVL
jgi:type IV pilus assembly protein PilW